MAFKLSHKLFDTSEVNKVIVAADIVEPDAPNVPPDDKTAARYTCASVVPLAGVVVEGVGVLVGVDVDVLVGVDVKVGVVVGVDVKVVVGVEVLVGVIV
jgi:hypothetical protein